MSIVAELQIQMAADVARLSRDMNSVRSTVGGVMGQIESRIQQTMRIASQFGVAFAGIEGIKAVSNLSDDYVKLTGQIKIATATGQEFALAQQRVAQIANSTQANLSAIATLYARISNSSKDLGVSQDQVAKITETVALALKAGGASTEEAASAMLQLSQAFGSGRLQGQEFNAVAEAAPNLLRALAESIGVPYGQLKNLAAQGVLTTDVMVKAFTNPTLMASLKDQALQMQTVSGAVTVMKNNLELAVGQFNDATGASRGLADVLGVLANNMDVVVRGGVGLAAVFATRKVIDYGTSIAGVTASYFEQSRAAAVARDAVAAESAAKVANLTATQEAIALSQAEAVAKLKAANANLASAEAQMQASRSVGVYSAALFAAREAEVAATVASQARSVALAELSALGTQAASVQAKLAAATEAANIATSAGGTAASIAARALGFLGGPIGAITTVLSLGATAWALWGGKAEESEQKATGAVERSTQDIVAGLNQQIAKLKERNSLAAAGVNASGAGNAAEDRLAQIYKQIQEVQNQGTLNGQNIPNSGAKIAILTSLGKQYGELAEKIKEVNVEQKKATDAQNLQSIDKWLQSHQQYATQEQKVAMAIAQAQKELGSAFTPELAQKIRDSIIKPTKELNTTEKEVTKSVKLRQEATAAFYADQQKGIETEGATTKELEKQLEQVRQQTAELGLTKEATKRAELANVDFQISVIELRKSLAENGFANRDLIGQYDTQLQVLKELKAAKGQYYDTKAVLDAADATQSAFRKIFSDIETGLTNALINGFDNGKGVLKSIRDYIVNYFKSLVVRIAVQPVIGAAAGALGIAYSGTAGASDLAALKSAGSGLSSFGSSLASNPIGTIVNGFSMLNSNLTTGLQDIYINTAKLFNGGMTGYDTVYNAGQFAQIANGIGSAVGYLSAINAGLNGKYLTGIGTAAGTYLAGPIGGLVGNIAGGLLDKVFGFGGGGGPQHSGGYYGISGSGYTGDGMFNGTAAQIAQKTIEQYQGITAQLGGIAQRLAIDTYLNTDPQGTSPTTLNFRGAINGSTAYNRSGMNVGRDQSALESAISDAALRTVIGALKKTDFANNIDALLQSVNLATASFKDLQSAIDQVNVLNFLNQNIAVFGNNLRVLSNSSAAVLKSAIDAAGGTSQFTATLTAYVNAFATDSQKLQANQAALQAQFNALNVTMPTTVDGLKALIDAQDLTTASGQANMVALIGLTDQFKQFIDAQNQLQNAFTTTEQRTASYIAQLNGTAKTALETATQQIVDLANKLNSTSDVSQRISLEGQLADLIAQRYQAEQDMLNQVMNTVTGLTNQLAAERANVATARASVLGYDPTLMTADQIRSGISSAAALGQLPSTSGLDSASQLLAGLQSQSVTQQTLIETLTGQKGSLQQSLDDATSAFNSYKESQLGAAQQGINAAYKLASQFGVWLNGNAAGTGKPFTIQNGQVVTDYQSIGYYTNNPSGPTNFKNAFYDDKSQVGGMTVFDAIYNANKRIADAQKGLTTISGQLASKTIELAQAQAKATEIQNQITLAEQAKTKAQEDFATAIQAYALDAQTAVSKLTSLREETVKYYQAQQALAQLMGNSASGLRGTVSQVRFNDLSAMGQLQDLQGQFASAFSSANTATGTNLAAYGDKLNSLIDPILQKAAQVYASGPQFQAIKEAVLAQALQIADKLDQLAPQDYQQQSLSLLDTIDSTLSVIQDNTMSANQLLVNAINDSKTATSARLEAILAAIQGNPIPGFANGGLFGGGLRMVGERGPELEMTGASRIIPNNLVRSMMQPMNTQGMEQKLDQIALDTGAQVRVLQAGFQALMKQNQDMQDELTALRKKAQFAQS